MSFATTDKEIELLVNKELVTANRNNPQFHSPHEGFAVLSEEVDELTNDIKVIRLINETLWDKVKKDSVPKTEHIDTAKMIMKNAGNAIKEAVQVAAMAQKYINYFEDLE